MGYEKLCGTDKYKSDSNQSDVLGWGRCNQWRCLPGVDGGDLDMRE